MTRPPDEAAPVERPSPARRGLIPAVVAAVVVVGLVVAGVVGWRALGERQALLDAAVDAEETGRTIATQMLTYDYRSLDEDFSWVERDGTEQFAETFAASVESVSEIAEATAATSSAEILGSGVHVVAPDEATVLVAIDSAIAQPTRAAPIQERWRIQLDLVLRDGRWLVDEITLL